jgi:hypothetical protein
VGGLNGLAGPIWAGQPGQQTSNYSPIHCFGPCREDKVAFYLQPPILHPWCLKIRGRGRGESMDSQAIGEMEPPSPPLDPPLLIGHVM